MAIVIMMTGSHGYAMEDNPSTTTTASDVDGAKYEAEVSEKNESLDKFDVLEYQVKGNTVLKQAQIEEAVYPFMGEQKTVKDVKKAKEALEAKFHEAGYLTVFVNIPEQDVGKGVVTLEVLEGKVDRLRVVGSRYYSLGKIKERVSQFEEGSVPNFPVAQKQLSGVSGTADRQVTPILRPGKSPGKVEVDLKVTDQFPFHGSVELNNRYSPNTSETRLNLSARYTNLWQLDHSLGVSVQVSPENTDQVKVLAATYVIPTVSGDYWAAYAVSSDSNTSVVGDISVIGKGNIYGLRYIHPLPVLPNFYHTLTLGADYKDFDESVKLGGDTAGNTPIRYFPLSVDYFATWQNKDSKLELDLQPTFSVRNLLNNEIQFDNKRSDAHASFAYLRSSLKYTQSLYKDWQLLAKASSQITFQPLISNEQFVVGGTDTVRGYLESNAFGDEGIAGTIELRTPSFARAFNKDISEMYATAFYDAGYVRLISPLPSQTPNFNLSSMGVGLNLKNWKGFFANLDYARALHDAGTVKDGDNRLHFRVGYDW